MNDQKEPETGAEQPKGQREKVTRAGERRQGDQPDVHQNRRVAQLDRRTAPQTQV